jgi:hypothetical protein
MQREDREPLWITPDRERERPTIRRLERPQRLAHQSSIAVRLGAQNPPKGHPGVRRRPLSPGGPLCNARAVGSKIAVLAVAVLALLTVSPVLAAPPTLVAVSHVKRHPQASWVLAPGSEAAFIQVATSPEVGTDGYFFEENVEDTDVLEAGQTHWLSTSQLDPGTYFVHVASYTPGCLPCPIREWSQIETLAVRNAKPQISRVRIRYTGRYVIEAVASFRYCDDTDGLASAFVFERFWLPGIFNRRARYSDSFSVSRTGCARQTVSWYPQSRMFGIGWHSMRLQVRDEDGGLSNRIRHKVFVSD